MVTDLNCVLMRECVQYYTRFVHARPVTLCVNAVAQHQKRQQQLSLSRSIVCVYMFYMRLLLTTSLSDYDTLIDTLH